MPKKVKRESQKDRKKKQSVFENGVGDTGKSKEKEEKTKVKQEKKEEQKGGGWFSSWFGGKKQAPAPVETSKVDIPEKSESSDSEDDSVQDTQDDSVLDEVNLKERSTYAEDKMKEKSNEIKEQETEKEESSKEKEITINEQMVQMPYEKIIVNTKFERRSSESNSSDEELTENDVKSIEELKNMNKKDDEEIKVDQKYEDNSSSESEKEFDKELISDTLESLEMKEVSEEHVDKNIIVSAVEQSHSASESEIEFSIDEAEKKEPVLINAHLTRVDKQNKMKEKSDSSIESESEFTNENAAPEKVEDKKPYSVPQSQEKSHSSSESDEDFDIAEKADKTDTEKNVEDQTKRLTIWRESFAKMNIGASWDNTELQLNFANMKTKHIDHDEGFGCISNSKDPPSVKAILQETSPFFNNETKMSNFRLSNFHFYSLGFHVTKTADASSSSDTVYLFRHFLDTSSLTPDQLEHLKVVACKEDGKDVFEFIKPVWIDSTFVCVAETNFRWFQVVSSSDHLPVQMNLVPFRQSRQLDRKTIFICPLPPGRHHILKMLEENQGWRKCGYEEPCVINKGKVYQFHDQEENDAEACGEVKVECRSEDTLWVKYGQERWRNQAFINAVLRAGDNPEQIVFSGQISLYETLRLDEDLSVYDVQHDCVDLSKLDPGVLVDLPFPGSVTYVDPFLQYVRQGSLTLSQLSAISAHMGYQREEKLLEDHDMIVTIKEILENWKDQRGRDASIVNFLTILRKSDVSLTNVSKEIYQNITNPQWI